MKGAKKVKSGTFISNIPKMILAFICSLALFSLMVLGVLKLTLFNQDFLVNAARRSDYAHYVTEEISEHVTDLGRGSNVPPEVLEDVIKEKTVSENIDSYLKGVYLEVPYSFTGKEEILQDMDTAIQQYAEEKAIPIDEEAQERINYLKTSAMEIFDQSIELPYLKTFGTRVMQYSGTLSILLYICGGLSLLLALGLKYLSGRWWHRFLRYFAYIIGGSSLMMIVLPAFIYLQGYVERIGITSQALYRLLTGYLNDFILSFIIAGGIGMLVSFAVWMLSEIIRKTAIRRTMRKKKSLSGVSEQWL